MTGLEDFEAKDGELVKLVYTVAKIWILDDYGLDLWIWNLSIDIIANIGKLDDFDLDLTDHGEETTYF